MSHRNHRMDSLRLVIGISLAAVMVAACPPAEIKDQLLAYRPECPVDSIVVQNEADSSLDVYKTLAVPGPTTLIPEFNDCQRFPLGAGPEYGPLVAIFARDSLSQKIAQLLRLAQEGEADRAISIAVVLSWDGDYSQLGIKRGFNCLYMWAEGAPRTLTRHAIMQPVQSDDSCLRSVNPRQFAGPVPLQVYERGKGSGYRNADFPPVARWDWDSVSQRQYIGIGCLDSWCSIGIDPISETILHDDASLPRPERRVFQVKGWYDEQRLAEVDATQPFGLRASAVVGTIFPAPNLGSLELGDYTGTKWPVVAISMLRGDLPTYGPKLNFDAGELNPRRVNVIAMCQGSRTDCGIPAAEVIKPCKNTADPWWARIVSSSGKVGYRCVIRRTHPGMIIPGIVRWRWEVDDERGWISCPDGCCEVVGGT